MLNVPLAPQLWRLPEVQNQVGVKRSTVFAMVNDGTLPPPVKVGPRCTAWPADEVAAIVEARIGGANDDDLRELIARLVARRPGRLAAVLAATAAPAQGLPTQAPEHAIL